MNSDMEDSFPVENETKIRYEVSLSSCALLSVSEHYARLRYREEYDENCSLLCGALFGQFSQAVISVSEALPVKFTATDNDDVEIDHLFQDFRLGMVKKMNVNIDLVGFYTFGLEVDKRDQQIFAQFLKSSSSIVLMKLEPNCRLLEQLPVKFFAPIGDVSSTVSSILGFQICPAALLQLGNVVFTPIKFSVIPSQTELIVMNHVFSQPLVLDQSGGMVKKQLVVHINAVKILKSRFIMLRQYVADVQSGILPHNHDLIRQIATLCHSLPTTSDSGALNEFSKIRDNMALSETLSFIAKTLIEMKESMANCSITMKKYEKLSQGLFQMRDLQKADDFNNLTSHVQLECNRLFEEALSNRRSRKMVEILDEMSNTICVVADTAECVRLLHPDVTFTNAAEKCVAALGTLIERLNTSNELYQCVRGAIENGDAKPLDTVDRRVTQMLLRDFETSGVHLCDKQREHFVTICRQIFTCGAEFMRGCEAPAIFPAHLAPDCLKNYVSNNNLILHSALFDSADAKIRRYGYHFYYAPTGSQEALLNKLLSNRNCMARLVGYDNFADRAVESMLLSNADDVASFLESTIEAIRLRTEREMVMLRRRNNDEPVNIWDLPYATHVARQKMFKLDRASSPYFRLDKIIHNLREILKQIYGVQLDAEAVEEGEVWHEAVTKWVIRDKDGRALGTVYCDWLDRVGKVGDSHFTIQCSKQMPDGSCQLPIVVLSFRLTPINGAAVYLSHMQLENLLHEVGHALHSLFGRTRYQHVAGTRCSTDFAEVPSNLMEHWASDEKILSHLVGDQFSRGMLQGICASRRAFRAIELTQQALMALTDLRMHQNYNDQMDSVQFCRRLFDSAGYGDWMPEGTAWQHRFSHVVPYGSKYSSYLIARGAASLIWRHCFANDPLNSEAGARWREVLANGGELSTENLLKQAIGAVPTGNDLANALYDDVTADARALPLNE